jgi:hypothetical protein
MSDPQIQHDRLLREHGFELVRSRKHRVYQDADGRVYVVASTPSDHFAWKNALGTIKRVVAAPPKPLVLAISEFEREQAALVIQGEERRGLGGGSSKQRRSQGTGIWYDDKIELVETLPRRQELARLARENKERRQGRIKDRRVVKLERRAIKNRADAEKARLLALANEESDRIFEENVGGFMGLCSRILVTLNERYITRDEFLQERPWWQENEYYEFKNEHRHAIRIFKSAVKWDDSEVLGPDTIDYMNRVVSASLSLNRPADRRLANPSPIPRVMNFVKKTIRDFGLTRACPLVLVMNKLMWHEQALIENLPNRPSSFGIHDVLYGRLAQILSHCSLGRTPADNDIVMICKDGFAVLHEGDHVTKIDCPIEHPVSMRYDEITEEALKFTNDVETPAWFQNLTRAAYFPGKLPDFPEKAAAAT